MDQREIDEIKRQLEEAHELPEKAMSLILKVLNRLAAHLESERDQRTQLLTVLESSKVTMETFKRQLEGHYENGDRKAGIMERFDRVEEQTKESRDQAKDNSKMIKKAAIIIICGVFLQLAAIVFGKIRFGP